MKHRSLVLGLATWLLPTACAAIAGESDVPNASDAGLEDGSMRSDSGSGGRDSGMNSSSSNAGDSGAGGADSASSPDGAAGFSMSAPASLLLQQGASAPVTVTVARSGGFSDAIAVTVSGLPAGATVNPLTITNGSNSGPLTIVVGSTTPQGTSHLSIDGVAANGTISASTTMDLVVRGPPGSIDSNFGNGGIVSGFLTTTNFGTFDAAAIDTSGNVLVVIDSQLGGGQVLVVRIRPDGTLDPTFGTAGIATVPDTGVHFDAVFPLSGGDIELCGLSEAGSPWTDEYIRLTATGAIDTSYSPDGGIGNTIFRTDGQPYVFTIDATERVVETGFTGNAQGFLLSRRTAAGAADTTFDAGFESTVGGPGGATLIQPDGMIVATYASRNAPYGMGLVRTDTSGNLDPTFGTNGIVPGTGPGNPSGLVLESDGKLLTGGLVFSAGGSEMPGGFVARYLANGNLDITYGTAGFDHDHGRQRLGDRETERRRPALRRLPLAGGRCGGPDQRPLGGTRDGRWPARSRLRRRRHRHHHGRRRDRDQHRRVRRRASRRTHRRRHGDDEDPGRLRLLGRALLAVSTLAGD